MAMATAPSVEALRRQIDDLVAHHPVVARQPLHALVRRGRGHPRRGAPPRRAVLGVQPPLRRGAAAQGDQRRRPRHLPRRQGDPPQRARRGVQRRARRRRPPRAPTPSWSPPRAPSTAAGSASAPPTSSGCCASPAPLGLGFDELGKRRHGTAAHAVLLRRAARGVRLGGRVHRRGRELRGGALGGGRLLEGAHRRASRRSRRASAPTCRSRSGPGTTRSRTSTPPTPTTSWSRRSRSRGSTSTASSPARAGCSTACRRSGTGSGPTTRRGWSDERPRCPPAPALGGIDHLEWWVGNARAFAGFLAAAFGFDLVAYAGPETGRRDRVQLPAPAGPRALHGVGRARTPTARSPSTSARTATASATSASSSTTCRPPTTPPSPAAPRRCASRPRTRTPTA